MNPIHSLAIVAAGMSQFLAVTDVSVPTQSIPGILEGLSKLGVTGILGVAIWYLKKQGELKDAAIEKRDTALEKKDAEFKEYLMEQAKTQTELVTQTKDVMQAVLEKFSGDETIRRKQIAS